MASEQKDGRRQINDVSDCCFIRKSASSFTSGSALFLYSTYRRAEIAYHASVVSAHARRPAGTCSQRPFSFEDLSLFLRVSRATKGLELAWNLRVHDWYDRYCISRSSVAGRVRQRMFFFAGLAGCFLTHKLVRLYTQACAFIHICISTNDK